jgi:hypothetical protein
LGYWAESYRVKRGTPYSIAQGPSRENLEILAKSASEILRVEKFEVSRRAKRQRFGGGIPVASTEC